MKLSRLVLGEGYQPDKYGYGSFQNQIDDGGDDATFVCGCAGDGPRTAAATARAEAIAAENAALTSYLEQNPSVLEGFARDLLPLMLEVRRTADGVRAHLALSRHQSRASLKRPQLTVLEPTLCTACVFTQLAYHCAEGLSLQWLHIGELHCSCRKPGQHEWLTSACL